MKKIIITIILLLVCLLIVIKINSWQNKELAELKQSAYQEDKKQPVTTPSPSSTVSTPKTSSNSTTTSSTTSKKRIDPTLADDFEKLVVTNSSPIVFAASVEGEKGPAVVKSDSKILAIWVTREWDYLTDIDKRTLVKLHFDVFSQWRGKDDGIISVFDATDTQLAFGTKYSTRIYK